MISIPMGGFDVVLEVQWLQSLETVAFNFQKKFMKFSWEGKEFVLNGVTRKPSKVINSNGMTKLLKKGQQGVIAQLCSLDVKHLRFLSPLISKGSLIILQRYLKIF